MPRQPRDESALYMPAFGLIQGGRLHGWRYLFRYFTVAKLDDERVEIRVMAKCTPPAWPFPCDIELRAGEHFSTLRAVPGERAKRLDAGPLLAQAYRIAGLEP